MKDFVEGVPVENAPESLKLFAMCENMKWGVLPVAGGLYDQHPRLLEEWAVIFEEKAAKADRDQKERDRKNAANQPKGRGRRR